jgi:hypothetical protein
MVEAETAMFRLDEKEYPIANLSARSKELIIQVKYIDAQLAEGSNMLAIFTRAKNSYVQGLKDEIIRNKAGF